MMFFFNYLWHYRIWVLWYHTQALRIYFMENVVLPWVQYHEYTGPSKCCTIQSFHPEKATGEPLDTVAKEPA